MHDATRDHLRKVISYGHRKGLRYLTAGALCGLARVHPSCDALAVGTLGHYESIAHHTAPERFDRHPFVVVPEHGLPDEDELFAIALATVRSGTEAPTPDPHGDVVDLLRAHLVYPRAFARTDRLYADLRLPVPQRARDDYMRYVRDVVIHNLRYPEHDAPGSRAMRMKLVFVDALPIAPDDPRLTDYDALVRLAEQSATQAG